MRYFFFVVECRSCYCDEKKIEFKCNYDIIIILEWCGAILNCFHSHIQHSLDREWIKKFSQHFSCTLMSLMTFYWHENLCRILIDLYNCWRQRHRENWIIVFIICDNFSLTCVALIWIFQFLLFVNGLECISQHLRIFVIQKISDIMFFLSIFDRNVAIVHHQFDS